MNPFKAYIQIVTPHTVHCGKGMSRSPKRAYDDACRQALRKLYAWDREHRHCSSIGMEWFHLERGNNVIASKEVYIA